MVELGHPEQLPCNLTLTIPFLYSLNIISPPSLATAGRIFVSKICIIFFSISSKFSSLPLNSDLSKTQSLPLE